MGRRNGLVCWKRDRKSCFLSTQCCPALVLPQDEMKTLLGEYAESRVNFMDGKLMKGYEKRWKASYVTG